MGEPYQNRYAGIQKKPHESMFSKVVDPAASAVGAAAGFALGGPAGAMAGYQIGHSLGDAGQNVANGTANVGSLAGDAAGVAGGWQKMSPLFFAAGGVVPNMDLIMQMLESQQGQGGQMPPTPPQMPVQGQTAPDMAQIASQARQAAGPAPTQPTAIQPGHPTWDMLSQVIPAILSQMPRPANPKNTKAIGAWLPAASAGIGATGQYFRGKREAANTAAQGEYEAQRKAYDARLQGATTQMVDNATQRFAQSGGGASDPNGLDVPMDEATALRVTGSKDWTGMRLRDWNARAREPKKPKSPYGTAITPRAERIGRAIFTGKFRPNYNVSMRDPDYGGVIDYLASHGYDQNTAAQTVTAENKYWQTQNDSKRTTMRQLLGTLQHSMPYTRQLVLDTKAMIPDLALHGMNKAALVALSNTKTKQGIAAQKMLAQIADISAEIGQLYMGGNANTDESFRVARANIEGNWNEEQLLSALDQIEMNAGFRLNAMKELQPFKPGSNAPIKAVNEY